MSMTKESQYARRVRERDEARAERDRLERLVQEYAKQPEAKAGPGMSWATVGEVNRLKAALVEIRTVAGTASAGQIRQIVRDALGDDA